MRKGARKGATTPEASGAVLVSVEVLAALGIRRYRISTGGWSGNEELLMALQANHMAWTWTWISSRVGGHYVFEVRKDGGPA